MPLYLDFPDDDDKPASQDGKPMTQLDRAKSVGFDISNADVFRLTDEDKQDNSTGTSASIPLEVYYGLRSYLRITNQLSSWASVQRITTKFGWLLFKEKVKPKEIYELSNRAMDLEMKPSDYLKAKRVISPQLSSDSKRKGYISMCMWVKSDIATAKVDLEMACQQDIITAVFLEFLLACPNTKPAHFMEVYRQYQREIYDVIEARRKELEDLLAKYE